MRIFFAVVLLMTQPLLVAQEKDSISRKTVQVHRIEASPKMDGSLDEAIWEKAAVASNFVERNPANGEPIPDSLHTEVKIFYDDSGIYFGAIMKDPEPGKIRKELTERDAIGNDDFFIILLNGYNDRQQSMQFAVTAAGVQYDAKMTNGREDSSWNAVWYSGVQITPAGWTAEFFIPYSELRFPEKKVQTWGLNMERDFRRSGTRYSWNHVDNTKGSYSLYDGELHGIENIQTPTRLSFQPYASTYVTNYDGETETSLNGGMDLKYGISDAFTLDMILVPDFGQTRFDDAVLNLSAFEVQYNEQRAFFTEGTELFTKGNLFYSRRVGGPPTGDIILDENEEISSVPASVDLINAFKISGRTDSGLGVGFFNAVTEKTEVEIGNRITGESRNAVIEPLTNYNVTVLDQRFGDNNSIALVNTSVLRNGGFRDANATGIYTDLTNKKNTLKYWANAEGSWVLQEATKFGAEAQAGISKISGKHRLNGEVVLRTKNYDINDLGYSGSTNYINYNGNYGFRYLQPKGSLNNLFLNFNIHHQRRLDPDLYSTLVLNFNSSFTTRNFFTFGGGFEATPLGQNDIYEPRVEGRFVKVPDYYDTWLWFSTDHRKNLAAELVLDWYKYDEKGRGILIFELQPRLRISDQFKISIGTKITSSDKEKGFADILDGEIIFGERNRRTLVNSIGSNFIFNNKMALNLAFRHYYSEVAYSKFYSLENNGGLIPRSSSPERTYDTTYNSWNIDLRFSWWFAPGSQLSLLYRNAIQSYLPQAHFNLNQNFGALFDEPQLNTISLRVSYYLDYNRMKNWFNFRSSSTPIRDLNENPTGVRHTRNGRYSGKVSFR